jgi:hypothetical protein
MSQRLAAVAGLIILSVSLFSTCVHPGSGSAADLRGEEYAGPEACVNCHHAVYDSCLRTAHNRSSREASPLTVRGSFDPPGNSFTFRPGMKVEMERRHSGLYQVGTVDGRQEEHRFDVVIGSGRKAQTFLYWDGDQALQLPISYFATVRSWANSPDFPPDRIWWGRSVPSRCFECHSSFIERKEPIRTDAFHQIDQFNHAHILYGIDCERCHGPAAAHVQYQAGHPEDKEAHFIARFARLSRQQKLDMCAVCHSGTGETQRTAFDFRPGDTLAYFFYPQSDIAGSAAKMDVHGNQYQLMIASKCYLQSQTLECNTCHAIHARERDSTALFSQRCMSCHQDPHAGAHAPQATQQATALATTHATQQATQQAAVPFCKMSASIPTAILAGNCIDCHMPLKASRVITLKTEGQAAPVPNMVRSHLIAIYPEETRKWLAAAKAKPNSSSGN